MNFDQVDEFWDEPFDLEELERLLFGSNIEGYLPDEDDPAWPSRSGQAD